MKTKTVKEIKKAIEKRMQLEIDLGPRESDEYLIATLYNLLAYIDDRKQRDFDGNP